MKVISVSFLNINSLQGAHQIRFDQPPFSESGLFAITGPTGAGKTTILDAITIALYGCVHRHGKGADECMTRFTGESFSEVVFEANNKRYRAKWYNWRARKKADGEIQGPKMELACAETGQIIVSHPLKDVKDKVVEVCGLDYEQFIRSVMLCQGDFTRFLKAKASERSELLEKITDTAVYSEISRFVHGKSKEEQERLQALKIMVGQIEVLSEDDISVLSQQHATMGQQVAGLQQQQTLIEESIAWLKELRSLEEKIKRQHDEVERIIHQKQHRQADFHKANLHERAMAHKPGLVKVEGLQKQVVEAKTNLQSSQKILPELQQNLALNRGLYEKAKKEQVETEETLKQAVPLWDEVMRMDVRLQALQHTILQLNTEAAMLTSEQGVKQLSKEKALKDLQECRQCIEQLTNWLAEHVQEEKLTADLPAFFKDLDSYAAQEQQISSIQSEFKKVFRQVQETDVEINKAQEMESAAQIQMGFLENERNGLEGEFKDAAEKKTFEEWQALKETYPTRLLLLETQQALSEKYTKGVHAISELNSRVAREEKLLQAEQAALESMKHQQKDAEEKLVLLQKVAEQQLLIQKYEDDRMLLEEGCPCPLCGSKDHPFKESYDKKGAGEAEQNRQQQQEYCARLARELSTQSNVIVQLTAEVREAKTKCHEVGQALQEWQQSFTANNQQLKLALVLEDTEGIKKVIATEKNALYSVEQRLVQLKVTQQRLEANERAHSIQQRSFLKAQGDLQALKERESALSTDKERLRLEREKLERSLAEKETEIAAFLRPHNLHFDSMALNSLKESLRKRAIMYKTYSDEWQTKNALRDTLQNEYTNALNILEDITERVNDHHRKMNDEQATFEKAVGERKALFGDKDPLSERARLEAAVKAARVACEQEERKVLQLQEELSILNSKVGTLTTNISVLEAELGPEVDNLISRLQQDGFESVEALRQCFLDEKLAEKLVAEQRQMEESLRTAQQLLENTKQELTIVYAKNLTRESIDDLQVQVHTLNDNIATLNQQIGGILKQLDDNSERQKRFSLLADQIARQRAEFERWERLSFLIGSHDGKKFRSFAQSLTLERLTGLANRHLQKFSDRYQIEKAADEDLELQIIDAWQADAVRPVTTLSGGESFLVSLALALGLSDLAGRKTRIESLFIDEGFGTLDADTLDVAISALENLQAGGKMIGIISHVEALKERIGTQIEVRKQPGGYSKVHIKSNYTVLA